ncbi:MAG: class I lanthipeptide [Flavobacteriaceae bacterium]|nr:class I lanthipeptide [Flavobacteriaceae bacterium]
MKKLKLTGKLSLNKETVARLSDNQMNDVKGGRNFLSLGADCTTINDDCGGGRQTNGIFCNRKK